MAVESTATTTGPLPADGSTTAFVFTFKAASADEVGAIAYDGDNAEATLPAFTVAGLTDTGGTVTFETAPANGLAVYLYSEPDFRQQIEFEQGSRWLASPVNEANDRAALRDLVLKDRIDRAPLLPIGGGVSGQYPVVLGAGGFGWSSGTGADAGLRTDLAVGPGAALVDIDGRTVEAKLRETVSVTDPRFAGGADPTGATDSTAAFQAAHDALVDGGVINVPAGLYLVSRVTIANQYIAFAGVPGARLKKFGNAGVNSGGSADYRGMFDIRNLPNAYFELRDLMIDLNGEGGRGVGVAGRIPNRYLSKYASVFPGIFSIAGPENFVIYALASSFITVENVEAINSGESGFVFRNCSDIRCIKIRGRDLTNTGIEFSIVTPQPGIATVPERGRYHIEGCDFEDTDDYGLGTGNGVAILFGGSGGEGPIRDVVVKNCSFRRCQRDIHVEFTSGTWLENFLWDAPHSLNARQGSIGLTGARNGIVRGAVVLDSGFAPTGALLAQMLGTATPNNWPSMNAITMSQDVVNVKIVDCQIIDNRNSKIRVGADGAITAGSNVFNSPAGVFTLADEGTFIGIAGAGPISAGTPTQHIAQVVQYNSPTQVVLDLPASRTVTGAKYAYGGAAREPLRANGAASFEWINCTVSAGIHSGLANEPNASAALVDAIPVGGRGRIAGLRMIAPTTPGTTPAGLRIVAALDGKLDIVPGTNRVLGFTNNYVGVDSFRSGIENPSSVTASQSATVSSTIDTFGVPYTKNPRGNQFEQILAVSIEFDTLNAGGVVSETVTAVLSAYRYDGAGPNTVTLTATAASVVVFTPAQLAALNEDGAWITRVEIKAKSDKASSTARARLTMLAREG